MTLRAAKQINPNIAIFFPLTPYPGTEVYDRYFSESLHPKDINDWRDFIITSNEKGVSINEEYSVHDLRNIVNKWHRKFYFRPKQFFNIAKTIKSLRDFKNIFRGFIYIVKSAVTANKF